MKVAEIIQQYAEGRRDFRNLNLRGQSFRGHNLSGADFSGCDLRGTNFRNAILQETIFHQAKAGLQKQWVIVLVLITWLISTFSGFLLTVSTSLITYFFRSNSEGMQLITGIILISFLIFILITIISQGLNRALAVAGPVIVAAGALAIGATVAIFTVNLAVDLAGALTFSVAVAVTGVIVLAFAVAVAVAVAIPRVLVGALAFTFAFIGALIGPFTGALTGVLAFVGGYLGLRSLKDNPKDKWMHQTVIAFTAIGGTSFYGADLTDADFTEANLKSTDLREANLIRTCWQRTKKLNHARLGETLLANPNIRDLMVTGKGERQSYKGANLRGANLKKVNLNYANLKLADLSKATLEEADLKYANLTEVNAVETNFTRAKMTGVCLEAWNIESNTKLDEVDCKFVYLLEHPKPKTDDRERRPSSGIFQLGEFTKLFQEVLNTVDLIFKDGINWQAFVTAFKKVQDENKDSPLKVQGIEDKGDGVIVVKLAVLTEANKENIHSSFVQNYNLALKSLETEYKAKLNLKDVEIDGYKRENVNMLKIINLLANQPTNINTEAITVTENRSIKTGGGDYRENNFQDSRYIETRDSSTYYENYNESQKTLAKAAQEIQNLLKQLEQDNPTASETEKIDYINDETSKGFKKRVVAALIAGGETAIEEFLDSPYFNIAKAVVKGWMNPEG